MKQEFVKYWMTKDVVTVSPETSLPEAHQVMMTKKIRRLPVVEDGRLVGIVTLGDIRGAQPSEATTLSVWELNYLLAQLKVKKMMTPNPVTVAEHQTVGQAARIMLDNKVSGLPVVNEQGELLGVITESDIFRMVVMHEWEAVYS